jgi:glycosyltransferase involved in cell wall biosynthesis
VNTQDTAATHSPAAPTKLLLYSHFFAPSIGGVETFVLSLARGLAALRTPNGVPGSIADDQPRFAITLVTQTPAASFNDHAWPFRVIRRPSHLQLWRLIRAADLLHVSGPALTPLILALLARTPVVVEHHGFQTICPNGQLLIEPAGTPCPGHFMAGHHRACLRCNAANGWFVSARLWLLTFARRFLCSRVAANITPTEWLGALVQLPGVVAIPHGLDVSTIPPVNSQALAPPVIAFVGRLVTTKGLRTLLEAAQILHRANKPFTVLIVGDGPERRSLESSINALQLSGIVRFAGRLDARQLEVLLTSVSIVVVPSVGGEVFGLALAENMLRGLPVVASNLGAFVEVLGDAGLTFETGNSVALAAQLLRLLDDPQLRTTLGRRARERASEFCDTQRMLGSHEKAYRDVLTR